MSVVGRSVRDVVEAACQVRVWRPDWPCPVGAILRQQRRGFGDPTYRIQGDGPGARHWRGIRTPDGPVTLMVQALPRLGEVVAEAWGPGADWALDQVPALLGADDDPSGFEPRHPVLVDLHRRHPHWRLGRSDRVFEALVPSIVEQKVTGKEAFAGFRSLVHFHGERAPGPGREQKLWLQPTRRGAAHDPVLGVAAPARRPGPLPHHRPGRPRRRLARPADAWRRRQPSCAPCPAWACGPAPRCASARSATPTPSASATTTSPRTSAGRCSAAGSTTTSWPRCWRSGAPTGPRVQAYVAMAGLGAPRRGPRMSLPTHYPSKLA